MLLTQDLRFISYPEDEGTIYGITRGQRPNESQKAVIIDMM